MNSQIKAIILIIIGMLLGWVITLSTNSNIENVTDNKPEEIKPLYWVAPMDSNFKRDKPGKSPMGMDLLPVYPEANNNKSIQISPEVINNLGVRTTKVIRRTLNPEIKTVGYVQFDEDQLIHIHPRVEGWIEKLYVKSVGNPVKKGQPIYDIYSPALVNAQEEMLLALQRNNKRLISAAEARLKALQLPQQTIAQLKRTKQVSQTITFFAPQTGVINHLKIREGFYVQPGTTLMSIGSLEQVWVVAEVFERQASLVSVGTKVSMSLDYLSGKKWLGEIDYIYPSLDPQTRTVKVRLRFNNESHVLKPNMFAQVIIHTKSSEETLLVPREAVIRSGNMDRIVLALGNGSFKSIEVTIGRSDKQFIQILSGLEEGDEIVISAQFLLDSESSKSSDFKRMNHHD